MDQKSHINFNENILRNIHIKLGINWTGSVSRKDFERNNIKNNEKKKKKRQKGQ